MRRTLAVVLVLATLVFAQDPRELIKSAEAKWKGGDLAGALADLSKAMELNPELKLHRARADLKRAMHDYDGALEDFKVAADGGDPDARLRRGHVFRAIGDYESAIKEFSTVLAAHTQYAGGYLDRAESYAILGKFKKADTDLEVAKYLEESNVQPLVRYYTSSAFVKVRKSDLEGAAADLEKAVEASPLSGTVHFNRARLLFDTGKHKESIAGMRKAIELKPDSHEYARLYVCLARAFTGERDEGAAELAKFLDSRKKKDDWYAKVAGYLTGALSAADFLAAAGKGNKWVVREQQCEAYWYIGALLLATGDKDGAKKHLEQCVQIGLHEFIETRSAILALQRGG